MFSKMTKYQQVAGRTTLFAGFRPSLSRPKAALTGLVRGAAIDLAPRAITVNNVQPGPTATDITSAMRMISKVALIRVGTRADGEWPEPHPSGVSPATPGTRPRD